MKITGKKILTFLGITLFVLLLGAVLFASLFEDKIGKALIEEVNNQLKSELKVESFDLSLLAKFPKASVSLNNVILEDAFDGVLLEAEELSFKVGLFSLLGSNLNLQSVSMINGSLSVKMDKRGQANYTILKEMEEETSSEMGISLKEATLEDVELIYENEKLEQTVFLLVDELFLTGEFSDDKYDLESFARMQSHFIEMDGLRYLVGKKIAYDAKIFVNRSNGMNEFEKVEVQLEDNVFNVDGFLTAFKDATDFDLVVTSQNANLESLVQILPEKYMEEYGDFRSKGTFNVEGKINGELSTTSNPQIDASISLQNGRITSQRMDGSLKDVSFKATYTNGKEQSNKSSIVRIENFKGYFNRELMELDMVVQNLSDPRINFNLDGAFPLDIVYGLLDNPAISDGTGEVEIKNLKLKGRYKDMITPSRVGRVDLTGELEFDDAGLTINDEELVLDKGILILQDNSVLMKDFEIDGAGSEIQLTGSIENFLPVLFADSLNTKNAELLFNTELTASKIDIGRLVAIGDIPVTEKEVGEEVYDSLMVAKGIERERITNFLKGTFDAKVDKFTYNKIEGENFKGKLEFDNNAMKITGQTNAMEGFFDLDGTLFFESKPRLRATLETVEINITDFFEQSENFGQDLLLAENVKGSMNAKMVISAQWDEEGNFLDDKLRVVAGVGVHDGELKGFKLLEEFSSYVNVRDLKHVKFVNMQNWFEIRKRTIHIPAMFIQNNAMNLTISGQQTFDDDIDYNIQVNAGQVLMGKFRKHNKKLEPIKAKKKGLFNLYFNISGTLDEYDYETNKRKVKEKFRRSEHRRREIKAALLKEFDDIEVLDEYEQPVVIPELADEDDDDVEYLEGF